MGGETDRVVTYSQDPSLSSFQVTYAIATSRSSASLNHRYSHPRPTKISSLIMTDGYKFINVDSSKQRIYIHAFMARVSVDK